MTIILDKYVCVYESNSNTITNEMRVPVHMCQRKLLCTCVYDFTIMYGSCTDDVVYLSVLPLYMAAVMMVWYIILPLDMAVVL